MRIILAVDDSPYANEMVNAVAKRLWPKKTEIKILTVLEPFPLEYVGKDSPELFESISLKRQSWAEEHCRRLCKKLTASLPPVIIQPEIRHGSPAAEIAKAASEWSADKILLGAHSRDVCPHNLLGSTSRQVASHAPCTVEIIRPKQHHERQATSSFKSTAKESK